MSGATGGADGWGPWIEHDGFGCPVPVGTVVRAHFEVPEIRAVIAEFLVDAEVAASPIWLGESFGWATERIDRDDGSIFFNIYVLRYQVRRSASFEELKRIAESPAPVREVEPA